MGGEILEKVLTFKYISVLLQETLGFTEHVDWVYKKAGMKLEALRKIQGNTKPNTALSLFKSLVLPYFDYCDSAYTCTSLANLNELHLLPNAVCRTILLADFDEHIDIMHKHLGLLYLDDHRDFHMA